MSNSLPKITEAGHISTRKKLDYALAQRRQRIFWARSQGEQIRANMTGAKSYAL